MEVSGIYFRADKICPGSQNHMPCCGPTVPEGLLQYKCLRQLREGQQWVWRGWSPQWSSTVQEYTLKRRSLTQTPSNFNWNGANWGTSPTDFKAVTCSMRTSGLQDSLDASYLRLYRTWVWIFPGDKPVANEVVIIGKSFAPYNQP